MTKTLLKGLLAVIVSGTLLTSCKKEKENILPTAKDHLVGKWKFAYAAYDENGNKMLEENEKETDIDGGIFFFSPDGSGYISYDEIYYPQGHEEKEYFKWSLQKNDTELKLVLGEDDYEETTIAKIKTLNGSDLLLEIDEDPDFEDEMQWVGLAKQPL